MQKLKCELCNSIEIVKIDNDMFQCQSCGCKYTLQQAKSLISGTVEVTIGDSERNRLIKNVTDKFELGISSLNEINTLMNDFPSDYHGYWFRIQHTFREVYKKKFLFNGWTSGLNDVYSCLLKILDSSDNSELSKKDAEAFYENSFKELYDDLVSGKIRGLYGLFCTDDYKIHPLIAKAYQMGIDNAQLLLKNNICVRPNYTNNNSPIVSFVIDGFNPLFVLGKYIYWNEPYSESSYSCGVLQESLIPIDKNIYSILQSLGVKPTICPKCRTLLNKGFLSNKMKCPKCGSIY